MVRFFRHAGATLVFLSLSFLRGAASADDASALATFDAAWSRRAEGAAGGAAAEKAVVPAVAAGRNAVVANPGSLPARWRLMRSLYFQGEHATAGDAAKRDVFEEGKRLGEETLERIRSDAGATAGKDISKATPVELVPYVKGRPDVVPCFLWASVNWGKWALVFGKTAAARQGAAAKIRDYATAVVRLDPSFDEGGGYRVLGRLHHQTPSIPFITGWASRTEALKNLRLAVEIAPRNFVNRLYLAEAIWDYEKEKRPEAKRMLEALVVDTPSAALPVEDARAQEDARALLAAWGKG
jgi:tetratricopeptide (TPR) repeat protein